MYNKSLGSNIERFVELRKFYSTISISNEDEANWKEYEALNEYLRDEHNKQMLEPKHKMFVGHGDNFEDWIDLEYVSYSVFKDIDPKSLMLEHVEENGLYTHMNSFDNLGFTNKNVSNWHKSILEALQKNGYKMSDFYFTELNKNNKKLFQHIALKEQVYNFLVSERLINSGICPITGEYIGDELSYKIYGRNIFLSSRGLEVCKRIDNNNWNNDTSLIEFNRILDNNQSESQEAQSSTGSVSIVIVIAIIIALVYLFS